MRHKTFEGVTKIGDLQWNGFKVHIVIDNRGNVSAFAPPQGV